MHPLARDLMHPEDLAAKENLESIPLFHQLLERFNNIFSERVLHGLNMSQKIRLGPKQLPEIYRYLPPACEALGIPEPEFYLVATPEVNAYTTGHITTSITVTSGLIMDLEPDEIQAVVAHECGHIACEHTLYHSMADLLRQLGPALLSTIFGPLAMLSTPLQAALLHWVRRSELSADRAAAVVMKGPDTVIATMVRLSGGNKAITKDIDMNLYMEQAKAYDKLLESKWDQLIQVLAVPAQNHPFPAVRAREIRDWCKTEHFQRIVKGMSAEGVQVRCPTCGTSVSTNWKFCPRCGARNPSLAVPSGTQSSPALGYRVPEEDRHDETVV